MHWVFVQEKSTHAQLSLVRFDARSRVLSFLVLHSVSLGERICMARYQLRDLFDVLAAIVPIFLGPVSFRGPRIVRRRVLLSCQG